jgi:hypothetical protein
VPKGMRRAEKRNGMKPWRRQDRHRRRRPEWRPIEVILPLKRPEFGASESGPSDG